MVVHEILEDGESTEKWAINSDGFLGSTKQLTCCGRCGLPLPAQSYGKPLKFFRPLKPDAHILCHPCFDELPN